MKIIYYWNKVYHKKACQQRPNEISFCKTINYQMLSWKLYFFPLINGKLWRDKNLPSLRYCNDYGAGQLFSCDSAHEVLILKHNSAFKLPTYHFFLEFWVHELKIYLYRRAEAYNAYNEQMRALSNKIVSWLWGSAMFSGFCHNRWNTSNLRHIFVLQISPRTIGQSLILEQ